MTRVQALLPTPGETVDLDREALRGWLAERYARPGDAWVRVNLVAALGGQTTGSDGTSDGLTGGIDRLLLAALRRSADVVLVGAGTLRAERLRMPRTATLAVATRRGDLDAAALPEPTADGRRALVLCPQPRRGRAARAPRRPRDGRPGRRRPERGPGGCSSRRSPRRGCRASSARAAPSSPAGSSPQASSTSST